MNSIISHPEIERESLFCEASSDETSSRLWKKKKDKVSN